MATTMRYQLLPSSFFLVVHAPLAPSSAEWTAHVKEMEAHIAEIRGLVILSGGSVPDAGQRREVSEMFGRAPKHPKVAVLTTSTIERHVITALSWIMRNPIRGFPAERASQAFDFLDMSRDTREEILERARTWARELENPSASVLEK